MRPCRVPQIFRSRESGSVWAAPTLYSAFMAFSAFLLIILLLVIIILINFFN